MLPKISVITPTLNQGQFIEDTIRSVLLQNYPNLEYIVIDGGSTDGTQDILKRYDDAIAWISEPDKGQVDAINKGFAKATGEVIAYLNSDDMYLPNTLLAVGKAFLAAPQAQIFTGKCINIDVNGKTIRPLITSYKNLLLSFGNDKILKIINYISQPATFWRINLLDSIGYFNPDYRFAMDYDYWLRISQSHKIYFLDQYLANFRIYPSSISGSDSKKQFEEEYRVSKKYSNPFILLLHLIHSKLSYFVYRNFVNKKTTV
jgi:glycosyltransferase involved in cell wall biosynthesis